MGIEEPKRQVIVAPNQSWLRIIALSVKVSALYFLWSDNWAFRTSSPPHLRTSLGIVRKKDAEGPRVGSVRLLDRGWETSQYTIVPLLMKFLEFGATSFELTFAIGCDKL